MRKRLKELGAPIYGRKEQLWARLSKAEQDEVIKKAHTAELIRRRAEATEANPQIEPRVVAGPAAPSEEERAAHGVLHLKFAPWCAECVMGYGASRSHVTHDFESRDTGRPEILMDFAYLKTDGEWTEWGDGAPPAAEVFSTVLVIVDRDTRDQSTCTGSEGAAVDARKEGDESGRGLIERQRFDGGRGRSDKMVASSRADLQAGSRAALRQKADRRRSVVDVARALHGVGEQYVPC